MTPRPAAFLDRDGVINVDRGYVVRKEDFEFVDGAFEGAAALQQLGFSLVVVTNQSGIGRGLYSESDFLAVNRWMTSQFVRRSIRIEGVYYCPHHPTDALDPYRYPCDCRKPAPGMLLRAARELNLDLKRSAMFGDRASDMSAAIAADVPLRFLLGIDGLSRPAADGLSTAQFANLREAAASMELKHAVDRCAGVQ